MKKDKSIKNVRNSIIAGGNIENTQNEISINSNIKKSFYKQPSFWGGVISGIISTVIAEFIIKFFIA